MLAAYATAHGFGHATRLCEVLREVRARAPGLPVTFTGLLPAPLVTRAVAPPLVLRRVACDAGLAQRDALEIDLPASAAACAAFDAGWEARVEAEAAFLRGSGARLVVSDLPALPFEAAARAGLPAVGLGNFGWDAIYGHLAPGAPALAAAAARARAAYGTAALLLELPFAVGVDAFARRERVGMVARRPALPRAEARRRLGLGGTTVLVSFGGVGLPGLSREALAARHPDLAFVFPEDVPFDRLDALGLDYPDVVAAADVVLTKPGYGIVTDAIAAGARVVYTDRGDFPEYPVLAAEMPRWLACLHVPSARVRAGDVGEAIDAVLRLPVPPPPPLVGAARAAESILALL